MVAERRPAFARSWSAHRRSLHSLRQFCSMQMRLVGLPLSGTKDIWYKAPPLLNRGLLKMEGSFLGIWRERRRVVAERIAFTVLFFHCISAFHFTSYDLYFSKAEFCSLSCSCFSCRFLFRHSLDR